MKRPALPAAAFVALLLPALLHAADPTPAAGAGDPPATRPAATQPTGPKFLKEIEAFEAADRKSPPQQGAVLFLGSSSMRLWKTLAEDFPEHKVINRGFGGSTIPDSVRYAPRIVLPYKPRTIVFYAGDNDLNAGHSPEQVAANFKSLVELVHKDLPQTRIVFVAIKPSPARAKLFDKAKEANRLVREFAETDPKRLAYADIFTPMLGPDGKPRPELFVKDNLHLNRAGYAVWIPVIRPLIDPPAAGK